MAGRFWPGLAIAMTFVATSCGFADAERNRTYMYVRVEGHSVEEAIDFVAVWSGHRQQVGFVDDFMDRALHDLDLPTTEGAERCLTEAVLVHDSLGALVGEADPGTCLQEQSEGVFILMLPRTAAEGSSRSGELPDSAFPDGIELGEDLSTVAAEELSDRFGSYLLVGYDGGAVVLDSEAKVLGHIPGRSDQRLPALDRVEALTEQIRRQGRSIPEECAVDEELGQQQLRLFCTNDETGPTIEILLPSEERRIVSWAPPTLGAPAGDPVAAFLGAWPQPGVRGTSLEQLIGHCDDLTAVVNHNLTTRHLDGSSLLTDPPDHQTTALGWLGDRALVWHHQSNCSTTPIDEGIYVYDLLGSAELLVETTGDVRWVELVKPTLTSG